MIGLLKRVNWRIFSILFAAGLLGVIAALPLASDVLGRMPAARDEALALGWPAIVILALLQNGILLAVALLVGMRLSERVGLRMPLISAWASGETGPARRVLLPGLFVGAAVGIVLVALEAMAFLRHLPAGMHPFFEIPLWKRLLAGVIYGGITEELLMRLFLLSLVAWLVGRWWKTTDGTPATGAFVVAIVVVAVLFGVAHLPATAAMVPLTNLLVVRAVILNGVAGVAFGYLYWRHGLEAAMLGHMSAHLVMQWPGVMLLLRLLE